MPQVPLGFVDPKDNLEKKDFQDFRVPEEHQEMLEPQERKVPPAQKEHRLVLSILLPFLVSFIDQCILFFFIPCHPFHYVHSR